MNGPNPGFEVDERSLGEFLFSNLKVHPQNDIIQINADTGEKQTVAEFLEGAIELAAGLEARGISQGDVIMLMANYSTNLYSVVLGAIFQNALLFPISPDLTDAETIAHVSELCRPKIVFCDKECFLRIRAAMKHTENKAEVIFLDADPGPGIRASKFADIVKRNVSDSYKLKTVKDPKKEPILIISSSGSTGLPKAILLSHQSFVYHGQLWKSIEPVKKKKPHLVATFISWITGYVLFVASCAGGFTRVYTKTLSAEASIKAIHLYKAHWTFLPPKSLHDLSLLKDFGEYDVSSMKIVSAGGAPLPAITASTFYENWSKDATINPSYGCSELCSFITEPVNDAPPKSAGRLIRGMQCKVTDQITGEVLGVNEIGKLSFKNDYVRMLGYWKNSPSVAELFDNEGFYFSGDIGYITEEGFIFITGRLSDLLLVHEELVSPSELENTITTMDGVADVAVVGKRHETDNYHPIAAVVVQPGFSLTEQQIITHVEEMLSGFKRLYGGVRFVDHIPRNANGKINRKDVSKMLGFV